MFWRSIRHLQKKLYHLYENCPSNRSNQNCYYLLIVCPSIPTAGKAITINQVLLSNMVIVVVFLVVVVVVVVVLVVLMVG